MSAGLGPKNRSELVMHIIRRQRFFYELRKNSKHVLTCCRIIIQWQKNFYQSLTLQSGRKICCFALSVDLNSLLHSKALFISLSFSYLSPCWNWFCLYCKNWNSWFKKEAPTLLGMYFPQLKNKEFEPSNADINWKFHSNLYITTLHTALL